MNYSTAVFLINKNVRAVVGTYEAEDNAPRQIFKTLDPDIQKGDFVIVPTSTRHKMTVVKIVDIDVDVDFDSGSQMLWIIASVDTVDHEKTLKMEQAAISQIKSAEVRKKRDDLAAALLANVGELKTLEISAMGGDAVPKSSAS